MPVVAPSETELALALQDDKEWRACWSQLFECLPSAPNAMGTLFGLSVSQSGSRVFVHGEATAPVAVLILGFGGADKLNGLKPVEDAYKKLRPGWRLVSTTFTGLSGPAAEAEIAKQMEAVADALAACPRVILHSMSNNGYYAYLKLMNSIPTLSDKLIGSIYDCGVVSGGHLGNEEWFQIFSKTVLGVMVLANLKPPGMSMPKAKERLETASRALVAANTFGKSSSSETVQEQCRKEQPVPTLCLTSPYDPVVPEVGVRAFAETLRKAHPQRQVDVCSIPAAHCQLGSTKPDLYEAAILDLITKAEVRGKPTPAVSATPSTSEVAAARATAVPSIDVSDTAPLDGTGGSQEADPRLLEVLEEAGCHGVAERDSLIGVSSQAWVEQLEASRPAFLKLLAD